jgi:thymidylate synthase (FAD)
MGDRDIIGRWMASGEESMVEMGDATFFIVCSRVVTHELVRHRIASYQQESQRFVRYDEEEPDLLFYEPVMVEDAEGPYWKQLESSLAAYQAARNSGVAPQYARYLLPNATRTRIIVKANFREWRHIIRLRCHTSAQPEMQEVMWQVHDELAGKFPAIFGDLKNKILAERSVR